MPVRRQTCTVKGCSKWRVSGCNGMCRAHSTEAGNPVPRPVAQTCTVKGCSKWRQSGCNGMCIAHSTEAGNPVPRPVAQTCTVKGCSKWRRLGVTACASLIAQKLGIPCRSRQTCTVKGCSKRRQSGCNGMCMAHSREAGNPVPRSVAQTCTVKGCSKRRSSGCNGMCMAHSTEAGNRLWPEGSSGQHCEDALRWRVMSSHKSGKEMAGGAGIPGRRCNAQAGAAEHVDRYRAREDRRSPAEQTNA